jgi:hypothetical protein
VFEFLVESGSRDSQGIRVIGTVIAGEVLLGAMIHRVTSQSADRDSDNRTVSLVVTAIRVFDKDIDVLSSGWTGELRLVGTCLEATQNKTLLVGEGPV